MGLLGMEKDRNHSKGQRDSIQQDIKTLFESEIRLKQIAKNIEHEIWVCDQRTSRVLYVSPAFEGVLEAFVENFTRRDELGVACCM